MISKFRFYLTLAMVGVFVACSEDDDPVAPPTGSLNSLTITAGESGTLSGSFADAVGIATVVVTNADLGLNSSVDAEGQTSFDLAADLTVDAATAAGDYGLVATVTNTGGVSADFTATLTVQEAPNPVLDLDGLTFSASSSFTDANDDYYFEDYDSIFTNIAVAVSADGSTLTVTGDFLDWTATIDESFTPVLNLAVVPDAGDDTKGSLSFTEEIMGAMADGFSYRMSATSTSGSYDVTAQTISFEVFIDYDVDGAWVNWFTATVDLSVPN